MSKQIDAHKLDNGTIIPRGLFDMEEITAYKTEDGGVFEHKKDAEIREAEEAIGKELMAYMSGNEDLSPTMKQVIVDFVKQNADAVKLIIDKHTNG